MCGIIGVLHHRPGSKRLLTAKHVMTLRHRGPDGDGMFSDGRVELGHTRLSIIDLSSRAAQPMRTADGKYVVVFNGEIYNYLELTDELLSLGHSFSTASDTEVLLESYRRWGPACLDHFRGMFAFALWDSRAETLFLARDRCGERPLFFSRRDGEFYFASELKALVPLLPDSSSIDPVVMDMYLHFQYVPEPFTLLSGVEKLPAAHRLIIDGNGRQAGPERYWRFEDAPPVSGGDGLERIRDELEHSVALTLRSDVPVGVALSGGVDSGAVAAFASRRYSLPMHAFSVGYPGRPVYDEREEARVLAERLGMVFHEVEIPVDSFVGFFPELMRILDEPIADPAAYGHYAIPRAAADMGIKVLLTGIGGDELFWGYDWVAHNVLINRRRMGFRKFPRFLRRLLSANLLARIPGLAAKNRLWREAGCRFTPEDQFVFLGGTPDFRQAFFLKKNCYGEAMRDIPADAPFIPTRLPLGGVDEIPLKMLRLLFDTWLVSNCLDLGDRVSMAAGVESRIPFMDFKLIELVMGLRKVDPDYALGQKSWLRLALRGVLPDEVLARPKRGFQPPVGDWLSGVVNAYGHTLRNGVLEHSGILSGKGAKALLEGERLDWPRLFFAYKWIVAETWARAMMR